MKLDTTSLDSQLQHHYAIRSDIEPVLMGRASNYSVSRIEQTGRFCISWSAVVDLLVLSPTHERPARDNPIEWFISSVWPAS